MDMATGISRDQVRPQRTTGIARLATAGTLAVATLLVTACGGSSGGSATPAATNTPPATGVPPMTMMPPMTGGAPMTVAVVEKDFSVQFSDMNFTPGTHTFRVQNQGPSPHDLRIKGPGVADGSSIINNGGTGEFTVTLQPGTYEVWCSVDGHRAKGMETTITVG